MSFLGAKFIFVLMPPVFGLPQANVPQSQELLAQYEQVKKSIALVESGGRRHGVAIVVDARGYLLAGETTDANVAVQFTDGTRTSASVLARDNITRLVLLVVPKEMVVGRAPISISSLLSTGNVMAVTPDGPIRGLQMPGRRVGIAGESRYVPLTEYRFEVTPAAHGYLPIFNPNGELVGLFGAAYEAQSTPGNTRSAVYGPIGQSVGYSISPRTLKRVLDGFLSESHEVQHPTIGAYFRNSLENDGALIIQVLPGSPASRGGLQTGMVVTAVNGQAVNNAVDFAAALFETEIGEEIEVTVRDVGQRRVLRITVGADGSV